MKRISHPISALLLAVFACAAEANAHAQTACLRVQNGKSAAYAVASPTEAGHVLEWHPDGSETNRFWKSPFPDRLLYKWRNVGGERTWIGPQNRWQDFSADNLAWPPPSFLETVPFDISPESLPLQGSATLQTVGNTPLDCRRVVSLSTNGILSVRASFHSNAASEPNPVSLADYQIWSVTQLPFPLSATVRLADAKRIENGVLGSDAVIPHPIRDPENKTAFFDLENIRLPPSGGAKCYLDGDAFILSYPDGKLTITQTESAPLPEDEIPYRAQFYCGGHVDIPGPQGRYIEVEFAGRADSPMTVQFQWEPVEP